MFIGHFGIAFAAKRFAPKTSLATLLVAADLLDVLWPVLLLGDVEHVRITPGITRMTPLDFYDYPVSHSLVMVAVWALAGATGYYFVRRYWKGAWAVAVLILSHWFIDALVHRPDLPLAPSGGRLVGLGLWNYVWVSVIIEVSIFLIGLLLYVKCTKPADRTGNYAMWAFALFLLLIYAANIIGPPPPSVRAVAITGIAGFMILIAWSAWFDHHRTTMNSTVDSRGLFTEKQAGS